MYLKHIPISFGVEDHSLNERITTWINGLLKKKKIQKQNFKELRFIDATGAQVTIRAASGLKYRIEEE